MIDLAALDERDPVTDYGHINQELVSFDDSLGRRRQIVVGNKVDLIDAEEVDRLRSEFEKIGVELFPISVATMTGVREVVLRTYQLL